MTEDEQIIDSIELTRKELRTIIHAYYAAVTKGLNG